MILSTPNKREVNSISPLRPNETRLRSTSKKVDDVLSGVDISQIIEKKIDSIQPLPETITDLENLKASDDYNLSDLLEIINKDSLATSNILRIVNSPMYGFSGQVKNTEMAISLLGFNNVYNIVFATAVHKTLPPNVEAYGIDIEKFCTLSGNQSRIVEKWIEPNFMKQKNDIMLAAFLQEVGKIIISMILKEQGKINEFGKMLLNNKNISEVEKQFVMITSAQITAMVFTHWKFNPNIIEMIQASDEPHLEIDENKKNAGFALKIAKTLCPISSEKFTSEQIQEAHNLVLQAGFDENRFEKMLFSFTKG